GGLNAFAGHGMDLNAGTAGSFASQVGFFGSGSAVTGGIDLRLKSGGLRLLGGRTNAYAQIGHGGLNSPNTNNTGDIRVTFDEAGNLELNAGTGANAYAQIGHGGNGSTGAYEGGISIRN